MQGLIIGTIALSLRHSKAALFGPGTESEARSNCTSVFARVRVPKKLRPIESTIPLSKSLLDVINVLLSIRDSMLCAFDIVRVCNNQRSSTARRINR